jgi:hypothetical protein
MRLPTMLAFQPPGLLGVVHVPAPGATRADGRRRCSSAACGRRRPALHPGALRRTAIHGRSGTIKAVDPRSISPLSAPVYVT